MSVDEGSFKGKGFSKHAAILRGGFDALGEKVGDLLTAMVGDKAKAH